MKVAEAEQLVLDLIARDVAGSPLGATLVPGSPDGDAGTFVLDGRVARAIHHFDGWYVPINLSWFRGGFDPPEIKQGSFHWYAFADSAAWPSRATALPHLRLPPDARVGP